MSATGPAEHSSCEGPGSTRLRGVTLLAMNRGHQDDRRLLTPGAPCSGWWLGTGTSPRPCAQLCIDLPAHVTWDTVAGVARPARYRALSSESMRVRALGASTNFDPPLSAELHLIVMRRPVPLPAVW